MEKSFTKGYKEVIDSCYFNVSFGGRLTKLIRCQG